LLFSVVPIVSAHGIHSSVSFLFERYGWVPRWMVRRASAAPAFGGRVGRGGGRGGRREGGGEEGGGGGEEGKRNEGDRRVKGRGCGYILAQNRVFPRSYVLHFDVPRQFLRHPIGTVLDIDYPPMTPGSAAAAQLPSEPFADGQDPILVPTYGIPFVKRPADSFSG